MKNLVTLNLVASQDKPFWLVATIVGVNGPRQIQTSNSANLTLITLSLSDETTSSEVELTLWNTDCTRAATLRMLDVVLIRDAICKPVDNTFRVTRLALRGREASVRLLSDAYITRERYDNLDGKDALDMDVMNAAARVMRWRDSKFELLAGLRRRGALWSYDKPRHSESFLSINATCGHSRKNPNLAFQPTVVKENTATKQDLLKQKSMTFMDLLQNNSGRCFEISNVRVINIFIQAVGMSHKRRYSTQEALVDGCWRGCFVCDRKMGRTSGEDSRCTNCGGTIGWRFGQVVFSLNDGSTTASAKLADEDFQTLLFGATADNVQTNQEVAQWASAMLLSLAQGKHHFTALVKRNDGDDNDVDIWLRRLYV